MLVLCSPEDLYLVGDAARDCALRLELLLSHIKGGGTITKVAGSEFFVDHLNVLQADLTKAVDESRAVMGEEFARVLHTILRAKTDAGTANPIVINGNAYSTYHHAAIAEADSCQWSKKWPKPTESWDLFFDFVAETGKHYDGDLIRQLVAQVEIELATTANYLESRIPPEEELSFPMAPKTVEKLLDISPSNRRTLQANAGINRDNGDNKTGLSRENFKLLCEQSLKQSNDKTKKLAEKCLELLGAEPAITQQNANN